MSPTTTREVPPGETNFPYSQKADRAVINNMKLHNQSLDDQEPLAFYHPNHIIFTSEEAEAAYYQAQVGEVLVND